MATRSTGAAGHRKPTPRTDRVERALVDWIRSVGHRPGERIPPDTELARIMGVARGTLRAALARLEDAGLIVRRQGSGTFVAPGFRPQGRLGGLEVLESYRDVLARQGRRLTTADVALERTDDLPADAREALGLRGGDAAALLVRRTLCVDDAPAILMADVVHPSVPLPGPDEIRRHLAANRMMLDVLLDAGVAVAYGTTRIRSRLLRGSDPEGAALGIAAPAAVLELVEVTHRPSGEPVKHSRDVFTSEGVDLHLLRAAHDRTAAAPPPAAP